MSDGMMAYFGYGSLVNLDSLRTRYIAAFPARLNGWQRHWQARPSGDDGALSVKPALLSVHRDISKGCYIDGMLIIDHVVNLPDLDARELHYQRVQLGEDLQFDDTSAVLANIPLKHRFVYVAHENPDDRSPLLQSYLDVVMSGFHKLNGEQGVRHFVTSTLGFGRTLIADRHNPYYPRAIAIDKVMAEWFDGILREAGVQFD